MVEGDTVVKWLYPGADDADLHQVSDMESELQTDQSVHGSEMDKSSPTSSGTDVDTFSSEELPLDSNTNITAELGQKMTAASSYVGSLFQSSWYGSGTATATTTTASGETGGTASSKDSSPKEEEKKGTASSFSSAFFSTIGKVSGTKEAVEDGDEKTDKEKEEEAASASTAASGFSSTAAGGFGYLTSAFSKIGISGLSGSKSGDLLEAGQGQDMDETKGGEKAEAEEKGEKEENGEAEQDFFSSAFSKVGKAASTYTKVLQDTVSKAPLLSDFNQEQENFIKAKGDKDIPTAPWSGYQKEEQLKEKILALSLDQRNFLRAPPSGVEFDMESAAVSTHALVLLKEDPRLEKIRYQLVPKQIKEETFWKNYFYRVGVIQQSFELSSLPTSTVNKEAVASRAKQDAKKDALAGAGEDDLEGTENNGSAEPDEEFVSDSHQVSSKDLAEADEAMKKLGLAKDKEDADWEAELEGELEYEMVQGEAQDNPEWEEQIQELLKTEGGGK